MTSRDLGVSPKRIWPCHVVRRTAASGEALASITITTDRVDRMRDRVFQDHLAFGDWLRGGGPVLWAHDGTALPVAQAVHVARDGRGHRMQFRFLEHDEARKVQAAFNVGVLSASIGFIPQERRPNELGGEDILRADIAEVSLVPIPANADCHKTLSRLGLLDRATGSDVILELITDDADVALFTVEEDDVRHATEAVLRQRVDAAVRRAVRRHFGPVDAPVLLVEDGTEDTLLVDPEAVTAAIGAAVETVVAREVRAALNRLTGKVD